MYVNLVPGGPHTTRKCNRLIEVQYNDVNAQTYLVQCSCAIQNCLCRTRLHSPNAVAFSSNSSDDNCMYRYHHHHTLTTTPSQLHPPILAQVNSSLVFFLFSFQVHEKSILLASLPASLLSHHHLHSVAWFQLVAVFSMYPLLVRDGLALPTWALSGLFVISILFLSPYQRVQRPAGIVVGYFSISYAQYLDIP